MPPLVEQAVQVMLSGVEQRTDPKAIRMPGRLVEATNVVQRKTGAYGKRYGASALSTTTDSGTISVGRGIVAAGEACVLHANDTLYIRNAVGANWRNRGSQQRATCTDTMAIPNFAERPVSVVQSGIIYEFTPATLGSDTVYYYRVTDEASGVELLPVTTVTTVSGGSGTGYYLRAHAAGGYVWLFYATTGSSFMSIRAAKFDPATPTAAPVVTTYFTSSIGPFDFHTMATDAGIVFAAFASGGSQVRVSGVDSWAWFNRLDTATGLPAASPGNVAYTPPVSPGPYTPFTWVNYGGANGFLYLIWSKATGHQLIRITASTLAGATTRNIVALTTADWLTGYSSDGDTVDIFGSLGNSAPETSSINRHRHVWSTNTTTTTTAYARQAWVATDFFKVDTTWYVVTGLDDNNNLQRAYYLRTAGDFKIIARAMYGRAGNIFNRGTRSNVVSTAAPVTVSGNTATVALIGNDGVDGVWHMRRLVWNLADSYGPLRAVNNGQMVTMPGGWPVRLGDRDTSLNDLTPPMFPRVITTTVAASPGATLNATYGVAVVYEVVDGRGNMFRSSPCPTVQQAVTTNNALRITAPTLRVGTGLATVQIRTYLTAAGGTGSLFLNKITTNDPTVDTVTIDLTAPSATGAEAMYTAGSELSNAPAPPYRVAFEWRNRTFLTDTDMEGEVWASKEYTAGRGIEFAETLVFKIGAGTGRIRAAGPVDDNYAAFFKRDSISVIQGTGPDARGRGQYSPVEVPGAYGCTNPHSIATGPQGCYFQATDGGIYLLDRTLNVQYIGRGVDDHKGATITAAVHVPKDQQIRFYTDTSKILVFDYGHPTETDPQGQWYVWTNAAMAGVAAANVNDVVHHVQSSGTVYKEVAGQFFDGTNTPILNKIKIAAIPFSGILGYQQCMRGQILGTVASAHVARVTISSDYDSATDALVKTLSAGAFDVEFRPVTTRKATAIAVTIEQTESALTEGHAVMGLAFEILVEPRMRRLNTSARI
jgi:hypothetical protein